MANRLDVVAITSSSVCHACLHSGQRSWPYLAFGGLPDTILAQAVEDVVRTSPAAWHAWLEHGTREDISTCLAEIEAPVYVLAGQYDRLMPPQLYEQEIVAHVEGGHIWVEPDVGHLIPLEAPQAVTNTLQEMLL